MLRNLGQICGQVRPLTADRSQHTQTTQQHRISISNIDDNFFYKMCITPIPSAARLSGFLHTQYKQMFRQKIYRKTTKNLWQKQKNLRYNLWKCLYLYTRKWHFYRKVVSGRWRYVINLLEIGIVLYRYIQKTLFH